MLLILAFKNIVSRKSSFVIILFIAIAVALLVVTNSVFDRTEHGVQEVFVNSFTGDFVVRPKSDVPLSLFGDETPVTGQLTKVNSLIPYTDISNFLLQNPSIQMIVPQVSGMAVAENGGARKPMYLFGVDGDKYQDCMQSLKIVEGTSYTTGQKGAMLLKSTAQELGLNVGDTIQFSVADGPSFRIRAAPVTAIYDYEVSNSTLERYLLLDPSTLRSLLDMTETVAEVQIDEDKASFLEDSMDFDSLFDDAGDVDAVFEAVVEETSEEIAIEQSFAESTSWNFIIGRVGSNKNIDSVIRNLNKAFKENGWQIEAVGWRNAAGNAALYLYWMRIIFNIGILIVLAAGFIVVNNTLVINVLDRIREIGTMRAVGATRNFVILQFMSETFMITLSAGFLGCIIGFIGSCCITQMHITFTNSFLIQLFGGNTLITKVTFLNLRNSFSLAVVLGLLGWIYPVQTALSVNPVQAMQGAK